MIAFHTPQSLMFLRYDKKRKQWLSDYKSSDVTLDHYEKYGILEYARFPSWVTYECMAQMANDTEQMREIIRQGYDMLVVNVGNYKSILVSTNQLPVNVIRKN